MRPSFPSFILFLLAGVLLGAAAAAPHAPSGTQPADVTAALAASKGVAPVEVTAVRERDDRPSDGNLVDIVSLKAIKSSGQVPADVRIVKAYGGRRIGPAPVPGGVLYPNPLTAGQRYWMIFNDTDAQKYPQGVVAWWPEKTAPTAALEAAIAPKEATRPAGAAPPAAVLPPTATALALIEVTKIDEMDQRPADGDLYDLVAFKVMKSTGRVPPDIRIIKGYAYPQIAGAPARGPVPRGILFPNPLVAGQRYWVAFNRADSSRYQDGVVGLWPEKDAPAELDAAVTANKFGR